MSEKIDAFPYLNISKRHRIPYEDVLAMADFVTHDRNHAAGKAMFAKHGSTVYGDVLSAAATFDAIQKGRLAFPTT